MHLRKCISNLSLLIFRISTLIAALGIRGRRRITKARGRGRDTAPASVKFREQRRNRHRSFAFAVRPSVPSDHQSLNSSRIIGHLRGMALGLKAGQTAEGRAEDNAAARADQSDNASARAHGPQCGKKNLCPQFHHQKTIISQNHADGHSP